MARIFGEKAGLLTGVYLLATVVLVAASAPVSLAFAIGQYAASTTIAAGMGLLFVGLASIALTRMEKWRVWRTLLIVGFVATILSILYAVNTYANATSCSLYFLLRGFPFLWYEGIGIHESTTGFACLPPLIVSPRLDWASFTLDTFFYAGASFSLLEIVRGITQASQRRREVRQPF